MSGVVGYCRNVVDWNRRSCPAFPTKPGNAQRNPTIFRQLSDRADFRLDRAFLQMLSLRMPKRPLYSKLCPFENLIRELRAAHTTYREISEILGRVHGVQVHRDTINSFVITRAKGRHVYELPPANEAAKMLVPASTIKPHRPQTANLFRFDPQGRRINENGRLINELGQVINEEGVVLPVQPVYIPPPPQRGDETRFARESSDGGGALKGKLYSVDKAMAHYEAAKAAKIMPFEVVHP